VRVTVITISDRASKGEYADRSGPEIEGILREGLPGIIVNRVVVPDEEADILRALENAAGADFILTTGGTGIGPRDLTPDVTEKFCHRPLPGISELLRRESCRETKTAVLSRGYAGVKGRTVVVNFPGSLRAVRLCTRVLLPVMEHAVKMLRGEGHST
jgi:molybdenum cofactor biosynthesis protein B